MSKQWSLLTPTGKAVKPRAGAVCQTCNGWFQPERWSKAQMYCGTQCRLRRTALKTCIGCGNTFQRANRSKNAGKYCSRECAFKYQDAWHARRQGKTQPPKTKSRKQVILKAGGRCQCCGVRTRTDGNYLQPDSPEIDHIVPKAKGGTDDMGNLQLLCRRCNRAKLDRDDLMFKTLMRFVLREQGHRGRVVA